MFVFMEENLLPYWYMWAVGTLLLLISAGFVLRFLLPARRIGRELAAATAALEMLRARSGADNIDPEEIARRAMKSGRLPHLWQEYAETLHAQLLPAGAGGESRRRLRATSLAESFFTEQALVDTPLQTEFFKHLPGILTGLGIIGTFAGLIIGLIHFDVSLDPTQAQTQLTRLINSVGHAFFISAAAISLAMLFTWVEKALITARYAQVEALRQAIDGLFAVGASEEYLQRLVHASETAVVETAALRAALPLELGRMSQDLGTVLSGRLADPIADIAASVRRVATDQSDAVHRLLAEVLGRFSQQMQENFSAQTGALQQLLQHNGQAMQASAAQFAALTASMDSTGREAAAAMSRSLATAVDAVASRGQRVDAQVGTLVEEFRRLTSETQAQSGREVETLAAALRAQVETVVARLQEQVQATGASGEAQIERIARQTELSVGGLAGQLERLLAQSAQATQGLQATAATLSQVTVDAIRGMNAGADTLAIAADDFAKAGQGVAATMSATAVAGVEIKAAAEILAQASAASREVIAGHAQTRDVFAAMVADLKETLANAKRDASMTAEMVDRLQAASNQLAAVQRKSEDYLKSVSEVLARAHQSFAENIERTLRDANRQFHNELAQAVGLLSGAIKDLGDTIDDLPVRR